MLKRKTDVITQFERAAKKYARARRRLVLAEKLVDAAYAVLSRAQVKAYAAEGEVKDLRSQVISLA